MRPLPSFFTLSRPNRRLAVRTTLLMVAISCALRVLPFATVQRLVLRLSRPARNAPRSLSPAQIINRVGAVRMASRVVPGSTCLRQALAAQVLLGRAGQASQVRIGVARGDLGELEAHAWLEVNGQVVIGGERRLDRYTTLPVREQVIS